MHKLVEGFNRYMVECESDAVIVDMYRYLSFNRYMVECELYDPVRSGAVHYRFNRYMVECELIHKPHESGVA